VRKSTSGSVDLIALRPSQSSGAPEQAPPIASSEPESESRKKFTKSYGP